MTPVGPTDPAAADARSLLRAYTPAMQQPDPLRSEDLPEHVRRNQAAWTGWAAEYVPDGRASWAADEPRWGLWGRPEAELHLLDDVAGLDAIELGCGTAYVSAWLARRGARPVGVDVTEAQLATARALQSEHGLDFPLLHASAEAVPLPEIGRAHV